MRSFLTVIVAVVSVVSAADTKFDAKKVIALAAQQYEKLVYQIHLGLEYPTSGLPKST